MHTHGDVCVLCTYVWKCLHVWLLFVVLVTVGETEQQALHSSCVSFSLTACSSLGFRSLQRSWSTDWDQAVRECTVLSAVTMMLHVHVGALMPVYACVCYI